MALEDLTGPNVFICNLVRENPEGTDPKSQGDDHIRGIKNVLLNTYPNVCDEAITWTAPQANAIIPALTQLWNQELGSIKSFALGIPAGSGYLDCNGQEVLRADFPLLFAYLGVAFGDGDTFTTFNLPDYRGQFLRAQDQGRGLDPDAAIRTARADGTAGDAPGTTQTSDNIGHSHTQGSGANTNPDNGANVATANPGLTHNVTRTTFFNPHAHASVAGSVSGNLEARPVNIYVTMGIKADQAVPIP